ncbi:unnamed protein product, partial [Allacma fusca]
NYVTSMAFNSVRPILGGVFERVELFGTHRVKWMTELHKSLPKETIPSWYGGQKDYKPLEIYG